MINTFISSCFTDTKTLVSSWYDWLTGNNTTVNNNIPAEDSISRNSSGSSSTRSTSSGSTISSSSTIKLSYLRTDRLPITPPLSRSATPLPLPEDIEIN